MLWLLLTQALNTRQIPAVKYITLLWERFCAWGDVLIQRPVRTVNLFLPSEQSSWIDYTVIYQDEESHKNTHYVQSDSSHTYLGQLKMYQINSSTLWACSLELLMDDCLNELFYICVVCLLLCSITLWEILWDSFIALCCDSEAVYDLPDLCTITGKRDVQLIMTQLLGHDL